MTPPPADGLPPAVRAVGTASCRLASAGGGVISASELSVSRVLADADAVLSRAGIPSARREGETLLAAILGCRPLEVYLAEALMQEQIRRFAAWIVLRARGMPTQYLTGRVRFYGQDFVVTPDTFIPRPETELVVEAALACARRLDGSAHQLQLLDIGTGCGNLAVSLTRALSSAKILGLDCSWSALGVARLNAVRLGVAERIRFVQGDGLSGVARKLTSHIIVANPPYIPSGELPQLPPEVQQEPRMALDGGKDSCHWLRRWLTDAAQQLVPGGYAVFEIGAGQADAVRAIVAATQRLRVIEIRPDWHEIPRVLVARRAIDG